MFNHHRLIPMTMIVVISAIISVSIPAIAEDSPEAFQQQLIKLQRKIAQTQQVYQSQLHVLEQRLKQLEQKQVTLPTQPTIDRLEKSLPVSGNSLQIGLSGLFAVGGSNANDDELEGLQAGGHDPNRNGFTVQNVELSLGATVGPYFDAQANVLFLINRDGESVVELEEAFMTTRGLPWGLQVKAGQYFTEFGRLNPQHPHTWGFADQPIVLSRFFGGDGLRSQGARVSWLAPTSWYSELYFGAQNANGETVTSFLGEGAEGENIGGYALIDREGREQSDLLYSARWFNGFDISETLSMNVGLSGLLGPNASGRSTETTIIGADAYLKWQPASVQYGFPFISFHTEVLQRHYEAGSDGNQRTLNDWGFFSQVLWGFRPGWVAGLRTEFAEAGNGEGKKDDPLRDKRKRLSSNLSWNLTEYSKLRLQYNHDWADHLSSGSADSLFLQVEFNIGHHIAHTF